MGRSGFGYVDPMEANRDPVFRTEQPSEQEIATATADVRCKKEVNLVNIWARTETAYQRRALEDHADQLEIIRKWLEKEMENSAQITTGQ